MSKLKGIFEPFKPYVQNQLNLRKRVLGAGNTTNRPDLYHTYTRAKQCIIRMASGVNIREDNDLLDQTDMTAEGAVATPEQYSVGSKLAQDWVLEGGIWDREVAEDRDATSAELSAAEAAQAEELEKDRVKEYSYTDPNTGVKTAFATSTTTLFDSNNNTVYEGGMELYTKAVKGEIVFDTEVFLPDANVNEYQDFVRGPRKGIGSKGAYGDPRIRADKDGGFGMVPMPGITDAEIRTKSDDGSLREASVNFVCHNRRQLEILETLYMRPGYPVLLEWGWSPFITSYNGGTVEGGYESDGSQTFPVLQEFFTESSDLTFLNQLIIERKEQSSANYDGFIGNIKNFSFKVNESGGYECTTEIIAHGEILESLKSAKITIPTSVENSQDIDIQVIDKFTYFLRSIKANLDRAGDEKYINMRGKSSEITSMFDGPWYGGKEFWSEFLWFGDGSRGTTSANTQEEDLKEGNDNKNFKSNQIKLKNIDDIYLNGFSIITDLIQSVMKATDKELKDELKRDTRMIDRGYDSILFGTFIQETSIVKETKTEDGQQKYEGEEYKDKDKNYNDSQQKEKNIYVRWDLICQIINHLITPGYKTKHEPLVELTYLNDGQRAYENRTSHTDGKIFGKTDPNEKNTWYNEDATPRFYLDYSLPSENKLNPSVNDKTLIELLGQSFDYGVCVMPHQFSDSLIVDKYKNKKTEETVENEVVDDPLIPDPNNGPEDGTIENTTTGSLNPELPVAEADTTSVNIVIPELIEKAIDVDKPEDADFDQDAHNAEDNYQPLTSFTDVKFTNQSIGLIYFNLDHLINTYEGMRYERVRRDDDKKELRLKEEFSFFDFLDRIWKDANRACAGYYDFSLQTEHERPHVARVVDKTVTGDVPPNIFTFRPQGTHSVTRDFNFSSKISADMADVISIAAQSPNSAQSLDAMSFKAFHKNIKCRFTDNALDAKSMREAAVNAKVELQRDMKQYKKLLEDLQQYQERSNNQYRAELSSNIEEGFATYYHNLGAPAAIEVAKQLEELLVSINARYPLKDKAGFNDHPLAGQYNKDATNDRNAIIPLEFNLQMDGISGITPLNLFKIHPDKLPRDYQREDIAFIVKGESQKITAGQDWVTELNGQLTLLNTTPGDEEGQNELSDDMLIYPTGSLLDNIDEEEHGEKTPQGPKDGLINPVAHSVFITSPWGKERKTNKGWVRHYGVDIRASKRGVSGDEIVAPADGTVTKARFQTGACGGTMEISHTGAGSVTMTRYCHLKEFKVSEGAPVTQGDVIGIMGGNIADKGRGSSKATHLHYEVYDGEANPDWWPKISNGEANTKKETGTSDPAKYLA